MGRLPSSAVQGSGLKKGPWTPEEDEKLMEYVGRHGHGSWRKLPQLAGLNRCGKSCRLRWMNYLRPDIRRGNFSEEEERLIVHHHSVIGNKWSQIAVHLPGRTDNEIKNFWNTQLKKKLLQKGIDPKTHKPIPTSHIDPSNLLLSLVAIARSLSGPSHNNSVSSASNPLEIITTELAKIQMVQKLIQLIGTNTPVVDNGGYDALTRRPYSSLESQNMITTGANYPNMINIHLAENSWASSGSGTAQLPSLWPSCSKVSTESTPITSRLSAEPNASINVFEDLEKLMEDDTCASFLRDLLDE